MATKITNKLLKEAIADAEAVRETAIANAKLVLEESLAPQIKDVIARRLRVEAEHGGEEEMEDTPELKKDAPEVEEATEKPFEDAEAEGSSEMPADTSGIGTGDNKQPSAASFDSADDDMSGEAPADSATDWYDDWSEADFDLGEIIKELENDIAALSGSEGGEEKEEEMPEAPVAEAKEEEKEEKEELKENEDMEGKKDEEEVSLEEILAELENDEEEMASPEMKKPAQPADLAQKLQALKGELAQYREAVNVLHNRLQEVNLLNAKLLFTNKLFRKEGLNNDQKVRIVESFDRATTVREVKLVYTALVENLSVAAKSFNASRKKVVAEGFASKATPSTAPKKEVIVENTVAKRLQELAGII